MTTTTQLPTARPAATVLVVSTAAFLASLDLFIVNIAFPDIRQAFGTADLGAMSWVLNAYTLVFAAFMNPAGRLGDRYGHRRVFLAGLVVFTLGSATCGLSASFPMLVASRAVQALGAAMLMPSSLALLLAAVPASRRAVAVSIWSAVGATAAALGPPVGGLLVQLSWRWIFFVNVPVGLLAVVAGSMVLSKAAGTGTGVPDLFGALSLVVGVGALVWALIELPVVGRSTTAIAAAVVGAVCAMALAVWRSLRHPSPAVDLAAVRVLPMWSSCLAMLGVFISARRDAAEWRHAAHHRVGYAACGRRLVPGAGSAGGGHRLAAGRATDRQGRHRSGRRDWRCALRGRDRDLAVHHRDYTPLLHRLLSGSTVYRYGRRVGDAEPFRGHRCCATGLPVGRRIGGDEHRSAAGHGVGHHGADDDLPARRRPRRGPAWVDLRRHGRGHGCAHRGGAGHLLETHRCADIA